MTVGEIKNDIYFNAKITADTITQTDLLKYINEAYRTAQMLIRGINENYFLVKAVADLELSATNDSAYSYPTNVEKVVQVQVALQPAVSTAPEDNEFQVATFISQQQIQNPNVMFSRPHAVGFNGYFVLYPELTDTTIYPVTGGVKMFLIKRLDDLTTDLSVPEFNKDYHEYITWYVVELIAGRLEKEALRQRALDKRIDWGERLKTHVSGLILDNMGIIVEGQTGNSGWDYPFGSYGF